MRNKLCAGLLVLTLCCPALTPAKKRRGAGFLLPPGA